MKRIFTLFLFFLIQISGFAQKTFFDKSGRVVSEKEAYYYREKTKTNSYASFYTSNDSKYFEGQIINASNEDEQENVYTGTCIWYFKNGQKKAEINYNEKGKEDGKSFFYFENGNVWKEISYKNGRIENNTYIEYNEDGTYSRIFEEAFENNYNDWDLYQSDKSFSEIENKKILVGARGKEGTSRFISMPHNVDDFVLEMVISTEKSKSGYVCGIIYGFKDWDNYNYFLFNAKEFFVGSFYEGVSIIKADGIYSSSIREKGDNSLKILTNGEKLVFSINGEIQYNCPRPKINGNKLGVAINGESAIEVKKILFKELFVSGKSSKNIQKTDIGVKASGTGIVISKEGYIATNYHVIDKARQIQIEINEKNYAAEVVVKDEENDLAIIKIKDEGFDGFKDVPYSFKSDGGVDVGATVFTIGYPFALNGMGKEAKFTDGKISAKRGYNNALNAYQTSIPVQPGNSGGGVFTENGQLVGIINAKFSGAENASYAIKLNYLRNLMDLLPSSVSEPSGQSLTNLSLEEKIKVLTPYCVLIKIK